MHLNLNITIDQAPRTARRLSFWYTSGTMLEKMGVKSGSRINVGFGSFRGSVTLIERSSINGNNIMVPSHMALPFPLYRSYFASWNPELNLLRVGPLIGILTADSARAGKPIAGRLHFFKEILSVADSMGAVAFCFSPSGLDIDSETCKGYIYDKGGWQQVLLPLPDVVYNRVPARAFERTQAVSKTKADLQRQGVPLFNIDFLNKWHLYKIFRESSGIREYLPETTTLVSSSQLADFLRKYPAVYIKPLHSFAGKGIMKVSNTGTRFILKYRQNDSNLTRAYSTFESLKRAVAGMVSAKKYIIQQGIDLATYNNRPFDVRVITQRDRHGEWTLIGWGCRVAGKGSITTHVPNGGSIAPFNIVAQSAFGKEWQRVQDGVRRIVALAPSCIEQHYQEEFGILSMDIGIDKEGRPWLFEANSKPMEFDEKDTQASSVTNLIHYCRFRSGFYRKEVAHASDCTINTREL